LTENFLGAITEERGFIEIFSPGNWKGKYVVAQHIVLEELQRAAEMLTIAIHSTNNSKIRTFSDKTGVIFFDNRSCSCEIFMPSYL
jgi:hypothetical protein